MSLLKQYIVIFLAVLMTACGGGGDSAPAPDTQAPFVLSGGSAQTIQSTSTIIVVFSEGVDSASLDLTGTNASSVSLPSASWSTTTETDDTLTLTASTQWVTGTVVLDVADAAGNTVSDYLGGSPHQFSITVDDTPPVGTASPVDNAALGVSGSVVLTYDEAILESSIAISGVMQAQAGAPVLVSGTSLTIPAASLWTVGDNQALTVAATDAAGNTVTNNLTYHVLDGVVYVDITNGTDANSGSLSFPKGTIQAGITTAQNIFTTGEVRVATGTYTEVVTMADGISLLGGYVAGFASRDVAANVTIINSTASPATVTANNMVTANTLLDGFTINGSSGVTSSRGISSSGAGTGSVGLTISNNIINGGAGSLSSYGIYLTGNVDVTNNVINGGTSLSWSYGVYGAGGGIYSPIAPSFSLNTIDGGGHVSGISIGMHLLNTQSNIWSNTITAGIGEGATTAGLNCIDGSGDIYKNHIAGGAGTSSTGLTVSYSSSAIYNNTIYGGSGSSSAIAIKLSSVSTSLNALKLYNNTIDAGSSASFNYGISFLGSGSSNAIANNNFIGRVPAITTCLRDNVTTDSIATLQNNNFFQCDRFYDDGTIGSLATTTAELDLLAIFTSSGNVSVDPVVVSATDYHLTATSPASLKSGGLPLGSVFTDDKDGVARGWSIGAYVYVP